MGFLVWVLIIFRDITISCIGHDIVTGGYNEKDTYSGFIFYIFFQSVNAYARGNSDNGADTFTRKGWEEVDYLRTVSPELQVHVLITRYKHSGGTPFTFYASASDVLAKNPEAVKPVLFEYARNTNPPYMYDKTDMTYGLIFIIINRIFLVQNQFFSDDEKLLLAEIYQEKLDYYLRTYHVLDDEVFNLDSLIVFLRSGIDPGRNPDYQFTLLQKFKDLGYGELKNNLREYD